MSQADHVIETFGGIRAMARTLGHKNPTTVQGWKERGFIPARHQTEVLARAREIGLDLRAEDFFPGLEHPAPETASDAA